MRNAIQSARILIQAEHYYSVINNPVESYSVRDQYMAENITWIYKQMEQQNKIIVWAHNGHVAVQSYKSGFRNMGSYLKEYFNNKVVNIGCCFYQGNFNALFVDESGKVGNIEQHQSVPPSIDSFEHYFNKFKTPYMFILLKRFNTSKETPSWLNATRPFQSIGALYSPVNSEKYYHKIQLLDEFDMMVFCKIVSPSTLLH